MSTTSQDREFAAMIKAEIETEISLSGNALDYAIDFISSNFNPEDVFSEKDLTDWAERNRFIKE